MPAPRHGRGAELVDDPSLLADVLRAPDHMPFRLVQILRDGLAIQWLSPNRWCGG
jgi:hypothetical protein